MSSQKLKWYHKTPEEMSCDEAKKNFRIEKRKNTRETIKRNEKILFIIVLALLILGFSFYWYEIRPMLASKKCINWAKDNYRELDRTFYFWQCLTEKGVKTNKFFYYRYKN